MFAALLVAPATAAAGTAARTGPPNSMTVLGDSISAGTGTGGLPGSEQKGNSWATGDNASVNSYYLRLKAINSGATTTNQSSNGKKMSDAAGQASSMPSSTELVLIEMGGNDLCKDTVDQMTSKSTYRSQFVQTLDAIQSRNPNALILVASIPDIYNLWFLRGAPAPPQDIVSSRAGTARTFWDTFGIIPCKSLVDNPTDMSSAGNTRRWQVRDRTLAFNAILKDECAKRLRCRYDEDALFIFSSNRILPYANEVDPFQPNLYASYLPRAQWQFLDDDVSTIDHFHPSLAGHTKLARVAWENGYNWSDSTAPAISSSSTNVAPLTTSGIYRDRPTLTVNYGDASGIKGIEYRVDTDGSPGAWIQSLTSSVSIQAISTGANTIETRALDSNGNLSASQSVQLTWDPSATALSTPPLSVTATEVSYRQALVSWGTPTDNGASTITGYRIEKSSDGGTSWTDAVGTTVTGNSRTVTGLSPATSYRFRVKAINGVGTSAESNIPTAVTRTLSVPFTPQAPSAVGGQPGSSLVSWTAPSDDGGLAISGYTVTASPQVNGVTRSCTTSGATSCTVNGLINGTAYRFKVTATNSLGTSDESSQTDATTPLAVPNAPFIGVATAGSNSASVSWNAPDSDGGLAITGYTATATPQGGGTTKTCSTNAAGRSCTVTGLLNGTTYVLTVTATNSNGTSPASAGSNSVTPVSVPAAPATPTTEIGNASIVVGWVAPGNGGASITGYTATATPQGGGTTKTCTAAGSASSCTITGLVNGTAYSVTVTATNSQGTGPASPAGGPVTPKAVPGAPTITSANAGSQSVTVNWSAPASTGGSALTGYTATATPQGGGTTKTCNATGSTTSCVITGLVNGTAYAIVVAASNEAGAGPHSATANATPVGRPAAPTITSLVRGNGSVTINWTAPTDTGGTPILSYTVSASPQVSGVTKTCQSTIQTGGSLATSCTITGLVNGQTYTFNASATNRQGTSLPSPPSDEATPATVPGSPTTPTAVAGNATATVNWVAPVSNGGAPLTGYTVTAFPAVGGTPRTCLTTGATSCTITGLTNGQAYTFTVVARNAVGPGTPSGASAAVTPIAPPPPVTLAAKTATPTLTTTAVNLSTAVTASVAGKITVVAKLTQGTKTVGTWTVTKTILAGGTSTVTSKSTSTVRSALRKAAGTMTVTTSFAPNTGTTPAAVIEKMTIAKKS